MWLSDLRTSACLTRRFCNNGTDPHQHLLECKSNKSPSGTQNSAWWPVACGFPKRCNQLPRGCIEFKRFPVIVLNFQDDLREKWLQNGAFSPHNGPLHGTTA